MSGTTNFQTWDEPLNNIETDAQYTSDTLRSAGITTGALLPSATLNKLYLQSSIFPAAFCAMMANKGFSTSDQDFTNLVAVLANVKTSADFLQSIEVVPYATSVVLDCAVSLEFWLTLTGAVSSSTLTNVQAGNLILIAISQNATGGWTFVWPSNISSPGAVCPQPLSTSVQLFIALSGSVIVPATPMLWITPSGTVLPGNAAVVVNVSANGTVSGPFNELVELVNATSGNITRTLFNAAGYDGVKVNVKKVDVSSNYVNVIPYGSATIDGFPNLQIYTPYNSFTLVAKSGNWFII